MDQMTLHILGCGSATPSLRHLPACQVIEYRGRLMMIDCGEGAQLSMRRAGLHMNRLTDIFISHLHGDHCLGLPGLLSTLSLQQTGGALTVHTFPDGARIFREMVSFFAPKLTYDLRFNEISPKGRQTILDTGALTVSTFPLHHRVPCVGFRIDEKPKERHLRGDAANFYGIPPYLRRAIKQGADFTRPDGTVVPNSVLTLPPDPACSYAYCSDTLYFPSLADDVRGVTLLYHEATYADDNLEKAAGRFHSTASQAARIALAADAGTLMLGHFSKAYNNEERHLAEARAIFPRTILANEGLSVKV
ncbi:MAG: ribonuclease Z [Muribaculaceae bacterium]|nr:ribonuclease Z [Muribaculaceae bacterium]MDE7141375.1 ribonuclease Z [Muribaculaceae bacterium]